MTSPRLLIFTRVLRRWAQTTEGKVTGKKNCDRDLTIIAEQRSPLWRITWHSWVDFRFNLFRISRSQSLSLSLSGFNVCANWTFKLHYHECNCCNCVGCVGAWRATCPSESYPGDSRPKVLRYVSNPTVCVWRRRVPEKARPQKTCCFLFSLQTPKSVKVFFFFFT